jgi:hypothetical protein
LLFPLSLFSRLFMLSVLLSFHLSVLPSFVYFLFSYFM